MSFFLGIDTSNYTTSVALYDDDKKSVIQKKKLLPVKKGELGLRQSDAVFHHTVQLPQVVKSLTDEYSSKVDISSVGVSISPCGEEGSYMPCFLVGKGFADSLSALNNIECIYTTHQTGHILAALYSAKKMELIDGEFLAFHVSGGTTDCLLCKPDKEKIIDISRVGKSLDIKCGQLIDRTGVMLDLDFPCGKHIEKLAENIDYYMVAKKYRNYLKANIKGNDCCLSGFENRFNKMYSDGIDKEIIALCCEVAVYNTIEKMTEIALDKYGNMPVIYAGGVMSNKLISSKLKDKFSDVYFAQPDFSCDNAVGVAIYSSLKGIK